MRTVIAGVFNADSLRCIGMLRVLDFKGPTLRRHLVFPKELDGDEVLRRWPFWMGIDLEVGRHLDFFGGLGECVPLGNMNPGGLNRNGVCAETKVGEGI